MSQMTGNGSTQSFRISTIRMPPISCAQMPIASCFPNLTATCPARRSVHTRPRKRSYATVEAHKNQKQKDGTPYALHSIRLSLTLETEEQKIVAMLHDVVEDTDWTFEDLEREGFREKNQL